MLVACLSALSCVEVYEPEVENKNNAPSTTLANVPKDYDTVNALVTLNWDGHDDDGYVVAFQYRYTTYPVHGLTPDSIVHDWVNVEGHSATISFSSPEDVNRQIFSVRSIDNSGNTDPAGATRVFYTRRTSVPTTKIISPITGTEFYFSTKTSYWFSGIVVAVSGKDQDGFIVEYGWSVDGGSVHWVEAKDSVITIAPTEFAQPYTGTHSIKVMSKDNTLLIDSTGASITVALVQPTFQKDILILDDTREDVSLRNVPDARVDSFYLAIYSYNNHYTIDQRDMLTRAFPSRKILGDYKLVIWHHDDSKAPFYLGNDVAIRTIEDYLHVGGNLILSGVRLWEHWLPPADPILGLPHPIPFAEGTFVHDFLHVNEGDQSSFQGSFTGATGLEGFSECLRIDSTKMNPDFPQYGKPHLVGVVYEKGPFTKEILKFGASGDLYASGMPWGFDTTETHTILPSSCFLSGRCNLTTHGPWPPAAFE